jgi:hypothetical protein
MQVATAAHQPPSAVPDQHSPTENSPRYVLHPQAMNACDAEQPISMISGGLGGVRDFWAEVRRHWLGGVVPA